MTKNSLLLAAIISALPTVAQQYTDAPQWIQTNKYANINKNLMEEKKQASRVIFMGNSITEGWSLLDSAFFQTNGYINRGISGQSTSQMLLRFRTDVINLKPRLVVILAGINDIAENAGPYNQVYTLGNIQSMIELAHANQIQVILCAILPANKFYWRPEIEPAQKVVVLNTALRSLAQSQQIPFVDFYTPMVDDALGLKKVFGEDGVHPSRAGYNVMKQLLQPVIQQVVKN